MSDIFRPMTLNEAVGFAAGRTCILAAGCTDLFPATAAQALRGPVLDLTALDELKGVSQTADGWRIGALTTWTDLRAAPLPPAFDGLKAAAREIGSVQIQNAGTIGGNLCNASPAADGVPPLLTLDAVVELKSRDEARDVPLADFMCGVRKTVLRPGEIMTAIKIPGESSAGRSAFLKLGARKYLVISIAMVAARIAVADGRIVSVALSVGACSPVAVRLTPLEAALSGMEPKAAANAVTEDIVAQSLAPIDDIRADAMYRVTAAADLVRKVLGLLS